MSGDPIIITCAVTGSALTRDKNPAVPITPSEIATSAIDAAKAGAAVVHIHVRDPETGKSSGELAYYREVKERIEDSGVDVVINLSTGYGGFFTPGAENPQVAAPGSNLMDPAERVGHIVALKPEICSLDVGTANFGDRVFMNAVPHLRVMSTLIRQAGVKPEIEVFEAGHVLFANDMLRKGLLEAPPYFQLCLGIDWCMPATKEAIAFLRSLLPEGAAWSAFGVGGKQFPMVEAACDLGGHTRVGLEDNLYLDRGVLAPSNAALVEKAGRMVEARGRPVATPTQARELLSLAA